MTDTYDNISQLLGVPFCEIVPPIFIYIIYIYLYIYPRSSGYLYCLCCVVLRTWFSGYEYIYIMYLRISNLRKLVWYVCTYPLGRSVCTFHILYKKSILLFYYILHLFSFPITYILCVMLAVWCQCKRDR